MNNKTKPSIPPISTIDDKGVQWTLETDANRWIAVVDGKKISSKDFQTLRDKVDANLVAKQATAPVKENEQAVEVSKPMEVALIAIQGGTSHTGKVDLMDVNFSFKTVLAKIEWNAEKGTTEVVRYKDKESGWKSSQTENLILFHPQFASPELKSILSRSFEGKLASDAYRDAEHAIGDAWWAQKEDTTINWSIEYQKGLQPTKHKADSGNSSSIDYTSSAWLSADPVNERDFSGWKTNEDGTLQLGATQVKMKAGRHGSFSFYLYAPGHENPVFENTDLSLVLTLGNATHFINSQPEQVVTEWAGAGDWQSKRNTKRSWPKQRQVHGAVLLSGLRDNYGGKDIPYSYILGTGETSLFKEENGIEKDIGMAWRRANTSYGGPSFREVGPEDAELDRLLWLKRALMSMAKQRGLTKLDVTALKDITAETLRDVSGAIGDGEELTNDLEAMDRMFSNMRNNLQTKVAQHPDVIHWKEICQQAKDEAVACINRARPKPQPVASGKKRGP